MYRKTTINFQSNGPLCPWYTPYIVLLIVLHNILSGSNTVVQPVMESCVVTSESKIRESSCESQLLF